MYGNLHVVRKSSTCYEENSYITVNKLLVKTLNPFPSIDFPIVEKPTTINLSTIKSLCPGQTVTVVAKVTRVHPSKCVGPNNTKVQNGVIVDPSGTMKLTLWRDFGNKVNHGETYTFKNFNIYKDKLTHEICLSTSLAGSIIEPAPEFTEVLAILVLDSTTTRGEIIGSDKVTSYLSCHKCNKKIDHDNETSYVECTIVISSKNKKIKKNTGLHKLCSKTSKIMTSYCTLRSLRKPL
jgi:DNA-directed RNA polymerase subunit RPC12/RpoP